MLEMSELSIGHLGQRRLIADRRRQGRIGSRALEGGELAIGKYPKQIDNRLAIDRIGLQCGRIGGGEVVDRLP